MSQSVTQRTFGKHAHAFDSKFYVKLVVASFALGAAVEGFMIATGFYDKVLLIESERRYNAQKEKEKSQA